jgi:hypothetical protein
MKTAPADTGVQQVCVPDDGIEGRPQLVAHHGQEVGAGRSGGLEGVLSVGHGCAFLARFRSPSHVAGRLKGAAAFT